MTLLDILKPEKNPIVISIAGGGGKTATMFELGRLLPPGKALLTTTTKIMKPEDSVYCSVLEGKEHREVPDNFTSNREKQLVYGVFSPDYPGKLTGVTLAFLEKARSYFDYLVVESDGSAGRPVKAPASHEPVISPLTDIYIGLIGLDCLDKAGDDSIVHRPELFASLRKKDQSEPIDVSDLIALINSDKGLFKEAPSSCRKIILLNKADLISREKGKDLCREISQSLIFPATVILNSYKEDESVLFSI